MIQGPEHSSPNFEDDSRIQNIVGYINEIIDPEEKLLFIKKLEQAISSEKERANMDKQARIHIHNTSSWSEEIARNIEESDATNRDGYTEDINIHGGGDA